MNKLIESICALIKVKTIVTIDVCVVFTVLALQGRIEAVAVMSLVTIVIGFYFGTQSEKKNTTDGK